MKHSIDLKWIEKMAFQTELDGHKIILDANEEAGGENLGPRPKKLLLVALAGCTGMDVVSILKKMRVKIEDFHVWVEGDVTEEHPKKYTAMKIVYEFKGHDLPLEKLQKAVKLSEEKYCGVSALYRGSIPLETEIRIVES